MSGSKELSFRDLGEMSRRVANVVLMVSLLSALPLALLSASANIAPSVGGLFVPLLIIAFFFGAPISVCLLVLALVLGLLGRSSEDGKAAIRKSVVLLIVTAAWVSLLVVYGPVR